MRQKVEQFRMNSDDRGCSPEPTSSYDSALRRLERSSNRRCWQIMLPGRPGGLASSRGSLLAAGRLAGLFGRMHGDGRGIVVLPSNRAGISASSRTDPL